MFTTLSQRIQTALSGPPKKTQAALARACGISPPSVNAWVKGETKTIEGQNLLNASKFLGVNPRWLATGEGQMLPSGKAEAPTTEQKCEKIKMHPDVQRIADIMAPLSDSDKRLVLGAVIGVISTLPPSEKKTG